MRIVNYLKTGMIAGVMALSYLAANVSAETTESRHQINKKSLEFCAETSQPLVDDTILLITALAALPAVALGRRKK